MQIYISAHSDSGTRVSSNGAHCLEKDSQLMHAIKFPIALQQLQNSVFPYIIITTS